MREHGVNVPDPKPGQKGLTFSARTGPGKGPPNALPAADRACRHLLRGALKRPSASELNKMRDAALKWAQCMRQHGVKVPDPATGDGGIRIQVGPGGGLGPNDPTFQRADRECRHLLPGGRPGGSTRSSGPGGAGGASLQSSG